jgi:hypothetical protein
MLASGLGGRLLIVGAKLCWHLWRQSELLEVTDIPCESLRGITVSSPQDFFWIGCAGELIAIKQRTREIVEKKQMPAGHTFDGCFQAYVGIVAKLTGPNGPVLWHWEQEQEQGSPVAGADNLDLETGCTFQVTKPLPRTLMVATRDGTLHGLRFDSGQELWTRQFPSYRIRFVEAQGREHRVVGLEGQGEGQGWKIVRLMKPEQ